MHVSETWSLVGSTCTCLQSGVWSLAGSMCTCLEPGAWSLEPGVWLAAHARIWSLEFGAWSLESGAWNLAGSTCTCLEPEVWLVAYARISGERIPGARTQIPDVFGRQMKGATRKQNCRILRKRYHRSMTKHVKAHRFY